MDSNSLHQHWVHSYEEDTENEMVFRPANYKFPPVRGGRDAIDLRSDKTFKQRGDMLQRFRNLAADDTYNYAEGSWELEDANVLSISKTPGVDVVKLKIISLDGDRLVVEK